MRIQFILTSSCVYPSVRALASLLKDDGHDVRLVFEYESDVHVDIPADQCAWSNFRLEPIESFSPHRLVVWNGHFPQTFAAFEHLRKRYVTRVVELGWLPQRNHLYLAETLAHKSLLSRMGFIPGATARYGDLLDALRSRYTPRPVDEPLPDRFVLIPAQLDFDTSFLFSPRFRTTDSFIGFVRHELPDAAIVVKNHPLQPDAPRTEPVYKGSANWNDLAARATLIAGLNSTTLPESLVQHRTVTAYADGPSRLGYAYGPLPDIWAQACEGKQQVSPEWMDYAVLALALNQFPADDPPSWVAEKILEERYVPNMLASF